MSRFRLCTAKSAERSECQKSNCQCVCQKLKTTSRLARAKVRWLILLIGSIPLVQNVADRPKEKPTRCPNGLVLLGTICATLIRKMTNDLLISNWKKTGCQLISMLVEQNTPQGICYTRVFGTNFCLILVW